MEILLINTNPVVSRLITFCIKDNDISLDEVTAVDEIKKEKYYDIVFIDDVIYDTVPPGGLEALNHARLILLSKEPIGEPAAIDEVVKKPFLPSKIIDIVNSIDISLKDETDTLTILSSSKEELEDLLVASSAQEQDTQANQVLDLAEIEKIKSLLETDEEIPENSLILENEEINEKKKREAIKQNLIEEGLEIVEGEEMIHAVESDFTLNILHNVDKKRENFEQKLLDAIKKMKIKKIKKLLKDAEITVNIRFKDDKDE
ncbi:MAG: hypothetical protein ABXS92_07410 [Sulfurimonas sp.]